jgi:hypothetical protein
MAKCVVPPGESSRILEVFIQDTSQADGRGLTGLAHNTSGLSCYYHRNTAAAAVAVTLVTMTVGTFTAGGFKEVDATNMPGVYQICLPDAAYLDGAQGVVCLLKGAANMAQTPFEIQVTSTQDESPFDFIIWIDDVNRTSYCHSLIYRRVINGIGTADFVFEDITGAVIPEADQLVEVEVGGVIRWSGTIARVSGLTFMGRVEGIVCQVTAQDFNQIGLRTLVNGIHPAGTLKALLEDLVGPGGWFAEYGISLDSDQVEGPDLPVLTLPWMTGEEVLAYLSELTNFVRHIDANRVLAMWEVGSRSSGVTLSIDNATFNDAEYEVTRFDYRNTQYVVYGPSEVLTVTDTWIADGATQEFQQRYNVQATRPETVNVDGVDFPVGVFGVDIMEWTWRESDHTLVQDGTPIANGLVIIAVYTSLFPNSVVYQDAGEVIAHGPWLKVDFVPDILTYDEALAYAQRLVVVNLPRPPMPMISTLVTTIRPGDTVVVDLPEIGLDEVDCFVRGTETRVIEQGGQVYLETTLDLIGSDELPANSVLDMWRRIILGRTGGATGATTA